MASSAPPILPISNQTVNSAESQPPIATPAFRALISHINETVRNGLSQRRPWSELIDRTAFSKPESISDATLRIRKNYTYFRVNYLTLIAVVLGVSLLTNPFSLILLLGLLAAWLFLYLFRPSDPPLVIFGRTFSERETLGLLLVSSIVVIFLTSVGSVLISALLIGLAVVCTHGAFRAPEDLFLDEQEPASVGFLSFLGGAASNVASAAAPVVAGRVQVPRSRVWCWWVICPTWRLARSAPGQTRRNRTGKLIVAEGYGIGRLTMEWNRKLVAEEIYTSQIREESDRSRNGAGKCIVVETDSSE